MSANILDTLSSFLKETSLGDIPPEVKDQAKIRIMDLLSACALGVKGGVKNPLLEFGKTDSPPVASILFSGKPAYPPHAAACNTFTANSSGREDGSRFAGAHPSSGIIPPALAAAQAWKASGPDLLTAVVLAYEVYLRIGYALYPHDLKRGFQPSAILAPFGSAAAAGKILNIDPLALRSALALAGLSSGGLVVAFQAYPSKCYQIARGVRGGFEAALLARDGMPGPENVLEEGFLKAYGECATINLEGLGSRFLLPETYLKIHGGCRLTHPCIDAMLSLRDEEGVRPEEVEEISIKITSVAHAMEREAKNSLDARFNSPFLVAAALQEGEVSDQQITDELLRDKRIQNLCLKTRTEVDPELDRNYPAQRGAKVSVRLKGGRTASRQVNFPLGEPENPLSVEQVGKKFKKALSEIMEESRISSLYRFLQRLEDQKDLTPLFDALTGK